MPSGLREARDKPPEGDPQFPPQRACSASPVTGVIRPGVTLWVLLAARARGSLTGRRQSIQFCSRAVRLMPRAFIAPRPCSRRLDAHGAEPRASGGPTARGMAWVTSPQGVKPNEPARGHGATVYGLPCACPCGGRDVPGKFPGAVRGAALRFPLRGSRGLSRRGRRLAPSLPAPIGDEKAGKVTKTLLFLKISLLSKGCKKSPRRKRGRWWLLVDFRKSGGGLFPGPMNPHLDGGDGGVEPAGDCVVGEAGGVPQ